MPIRLSAVRVRGVTSSVGKTSGCDSSFRGSGRELSLTWPTAGADRRTWFGCFCRFAKQVEQYPGLSAVGMNGSRVALPQLAHVVSCLTTRRRGRLWWVGGIDLPVDEFLG